MSVGVIGLRIGIVGIREVVNDLCVAALIPMG
jgi:hypothetical protein